MARTIEDARDFITKINEIILTSTGIMWGISLKETPSLIGTIGLWNINVEKESAEIGYELLTPYQGKGIMQEALPCIIHYGFQQMGLQSIMAELSPDNIRSVNLLNKCRFVKNEHETTEKAAAPTVTYSLNRPT
jgi:ribosomal-protein-alanine N-acetyltransferase